jgi:hypothetical protein
MENAMADRVDAACRQVIGQPAIFPEDVRKAARRLTDFFGDRRLGSIGRIDFSAYVRTRAGDHGIEASGTGRPLELARHDLHILGTLAGFADEIALWDLIQLWTEQNPAAIPEAQT